MLSDIDLKAIQLATGKGCRKDKLNSIARLVDTNTRAIREVFYQYPPEIKVGDVLEDVGIHWRNLEDRYTQYEGYDGSYLGDYEVNFVVDNIEGYRIKYFSEVWAERNGVSYEVEQELVEKYSPIYELAGTGESFYKECEILVDNDKKYVIIDVEEPNEEWNVWTVKLEEVI